MLPQAPSVLLGGRGILSKMEASMLNRRLLRAVLRTLLPLRAAVWAERGVCLLCGALLLACAGYLTLCWHAGPWPLLVCLLLGLRCCRNEEI